MRLHIRHAFYGLLALVSIGASSKTAQPDAALVQRPAATELRFDRGGHFILKRQ
jgi:hypothetical protein